MNQLDQEALYLLIYEATAFGDNIFELWLTVTFAAILAIYFSRSRITPLMRNLLIGLYSAAAVLLTGRWIVSILHVREYQRIIELEQFAPFPMPVPLGPILGALHFCMLILGTLATVYFMLKFRDYSDVDSRS